MNKKRKVVRYRRPIHLNIGVIVFTFVFIYIIAYVITYITKDTISVYEVQTGSISENKTFTGLALRTEEVTYAESQGDVNYYKTDGDKVGNGDLICSIDSEGTISEAISQSGLDGSTLSEDELLSIQEDLLEFTGSYSGTQFYEVYSFKSDVNAQIQQTLYLSALNSLSEETSKAVSNDTFSFIYASTDGVVAFYTDGYESVTADSFQPDMYSPSDYTKNNLDSSSSVTSGQTLYKTVTDEDWCIMVPLTDEETQYYTDMMDEDDDSFIILCTFKKDDTSMYATASIHTYSEDTYLRLDFNSSMVRFISDRYIEIELGESSESGLKIPNSSITEKEFVQIPVDYITQGDDSSDDGVLVVTAGDDSSQTVTFQALDIYQEDEEYCYVPADDISVGDVIMLPESSDTYVISLTTYIEGVYNINKGYAVFKQIEILTQNEEYTIIDTNTSYGITLYDHIAADAANVTEGQFSQ